MKIDKWLDIVCPYCYIGLVNFTKGVSEYKDRDSLEVTYRSFQLDPTVKNDSDETMIEHLSAKYDKSLEEAKEMVGGVVERGREAGLEFNMDKVKSVNTMDAHRLVKIAAEEGKALAALEALYKAHFTDGMNVSNHDVLTDIGNQLGLNQPDLREILTGNNYKENVYSDHNLSQKIGVQGVPFIAVNMEYAIPGARRPDDYVRGLEGIKNGVR